MYVHLDAGTGICSAANLCSSRSVRSVVSWREAPPSVAKRDRTAREARVILVEFFLLIPYHQYAIE